jgi:RHH-type proline utilization regulon transcriptional repressor/proline dehydrogenase/delta 1-pyrroline-5-carboxylate dehydrogenase
MGDNPNLWSPGVKYGVQPGSYTHLTEFFGPVLGVMRFERLDQAIALVNQTGYGLTSGLHSLDEREHAQWKSGLQAGNLYLNRGTTGALVLRQPFGGMGKSCFGPGLKAGGPNYLPQFMNFAEIDSVQLPPKTTLANQRLENLGQALRDLANPPEEPSAIAAEIRSALPKLLRAFASYDHWWRAEFSREHDHFRLLGQDNFRRYQPFHEIRVRVTPQDNLFDIFARAAAAHVTGARVVISTPPGAPSAAAMLLDQITDSWAGAIEFIEESDEQLAEALRQAAVERIRYAAPGPVPMGLRAIASAHGIHLADEPVQAEGRVELLWYLREQSLCHDYHRYGNLGVRADEERTPPR